MEMEEIEKASESLLSFAHQFQIHLQNPNPSPKNPPRSPNSPAKRKSGAGSSVHRRSVEDDNLAILREAIEFKNRTGIVPRRKSAVALFYEEAKESIGCRFSESQVYCKLRHLREKMVKCGDGSGAVYELSNELWGKNVGNVDVGETSGFAIGMRGGNGKNWNVESGKEDKEKKEVGERSGFVIGQLGDGEGKDRKVDSRKEDKIGFVIRRLGKVEGKNGEVESGKACKEKEGEENGGFVMAMQDNGKMKNANINSGKAHKKKKVGEGESSSAMAMQDSGEGKNGKVNTGKVHKNKKEWDEKSSAVSALQDSGKGKSGKFTAEKPHKKKKEGGEKSSFLVAMQDNGKGKNVKISSGECRKEVEEEDGEVKVLRKKKKARVEKEDMREGKTANQLRVGIESFPYLKHALAGYLKDNGMPSVLLVEGFKFVDQAKASSLEEKLRRHANDEMKMLVDRLTLFRELFAMLAE